MSEKGSRAAFIVLDITAEGYKDILSITVGANLDRAARNITHFLQIVIIC